MKDITYWQGTQTRVCLEQPTVAQVVKTLSGFKQPDNSSPHLKEAATGNIPELDKLSPYPRILCMLLLSSNPHLGHQSNLFSTNLHMLQASATSSSLSDHSKNICWKIHELLITQLSHSFSFLSLTSKCSLQHALLTYPQSRLFPQDVDEDEEELKGEGIKKKWIFVTVSDQFYHVIHEAASTYISKVDVAL